MFHKQNSKQVTMLEEKTPEQLCSEQQGYNSKNASKCKRWYLRLSISTLIASIVSIPIVASGCPKWVSVCATIIVALSNGLNGIFKFHEKWLYHRNLSELFKAEFHNYKWGIKEYKNLSSFEKEEQFKDNVRDLINKGNFDWSTLEVTDTQDKN